jgi:hypothetical protein
MNGERLRRLSVVVGRDGMVYPSLVTGGAYLLSTVVSATFGTILFVVFAGVTVLTGFGAMSGSSSNDALRAGGGLTQSATPGDRWNPATLLRLVVFDVGLAAALSIHAFWWAGAS